MSYWFIPVYIICLLYTLLITKYCNKIVKYLFLILVPIYYIYSYCNNSILFINILGQRLQFILYYIWTMLLGFELYQKNNKKLLYLYCLIFISSLSYFFYNLIFVKNFSLEDYKFVVSLPYILCSLASLSFILIFKNKIKSNILSNIGSKAIYMYITQGIGRLFFNPLSFNSSHRYLVFKTSNMFCYKFNYFVIFRIFILLDGFKPENII